MSDEEITEDWARQAPPGYKLNTVCANWMSGGTPPSLNMSQTACYRDPVLEEKFDTTKSEFKDGWNINWGIGRAKCDPHPLCDPHPFSTHWEYAGSLLVAMGGKLWTQFPMECNAPTPEYLTGMTTKGISASAILLEIPKDAWYRDDNAVACLAISRACAIMEARGITRTDIQKLMASVRKAVDPLK